jgi:hypothetical protein
MVPAEPRQRVEPAAAVAQHKPPTAGDGADAQRALPRGRRGPGRQREQQHVVLAAAEREADGGELERRGQRLEAGSERAAQRRQVDLGADAAGAGDPAQVDRQAVGEIDRGAGAARRGERAAERELGRGAQMAASSFVNSLWVPVGVSRRTSIRAVTRAGNRMPIADGGSLETCVALSVCMVLSRGPPLMGNG